MKYQAKEIMTKTVHTVHPETSMQDLKRLFQKENISSAPVIDEKERLVGVISKSNLLNARIEKTRKLDPYPDFYHLTTIHADREGSFFEVFDELSGAVKDYMTKDCFAINEEEGISVAAQRMLENRIHHLIVQQKGKVVGVLSSFDVLKCYPLLDQLEHLGDESVNMLMKTRVVSIEMDKSLLQAKEVMEKHRIRQVPVVDKGKLVGILSDRDLRKAEVSRVVDPESEEENNYYMETIPVGEIMTKSPKTITPLESLKAAAQILLQHKIGGLPVVEALDSRILVGIITRSDILNYVVKR